MILLIILCVVLTVVDLACLAWLIWDYFANVRSILRRLEEDHGRTDNDWR